MRVAIGARHPPIHPPTHPLPAPPPHTHPGRQDARVRMEAVTALRALYATPETRAALHDFTERFKCAPGRGLPCVCCVVRTGLVGYVLA